MSSPDSRTRHYGHFYGLEEPRTGSRVGLVVGNCQAESLRIMLEGDDLTLIRMPAVHELAATDIPHLERWLDRIDVLVSQPIRDDYHSLPLGLRQLTARASKAVTIAVPVIRYAGLYPYQVIVRPPSDASLVPPLIEYHDLRLLARAAGRALRPASTSGVRAIASHSMRELRRREEAFETVIVSDLFEKPTFDLARTINHPGNPIWHALALRVRDVLALAAEVRDPDRPLLNTVHAPRESAVMDAWGLDGEPTDHWLVGGEQLSTGEVDAAHLAWYADHPDIVAAGLARHAEALELLG